MTPSLPRKKVAKVWGKRDLPDEFGDTASETIGEVWFEPSEASRGLLVKYLFTSEKLSVQVHPSDADARRLGLGDRGKEECWYVLEAEPGAAVALGLDDDYKPDHVRRAAENGSIENMLVWHEAKQGDFFHVPPGTIHAIGPGLVLLEVQQNTDSTFRMFDYGRPRQLHLDHALQCANLHPYSAKRTRLTGKGGDELLLECDAFSVRMITGQHLFEATGTTIVIPLSSHVQIGTNVFEAGSCAVTEPGEKLHSPSDAKFMVVNDNQNVG